MEEILFYVTTIDKVLIKNYKLQKKHYKEYIKNSEQMLELKKLRFRVFEPNRKERINTLIKELNEIKKTLVPKKPNKKILEKSKKKILIVSNDIKALEVI